MQPEPTDGAAPLRVVLAEDSYLMREGIRLLIEEEDDLVLVASCGDLPNLLAAVDEHVPDVVITDIRMPPTNTDEGIRAAQELRSRHPQVGVLVLSQYLESGWAVQLLEDGSAAATCSRSGSATSASSPGRCAPSRRAARSSIRRSSMRWSPAGWHASARCWRG